MVATAHSCCFHRDDGYSQQQQFAHPHLQSHGFMLLLCCGADVPVLVFIHQHWHSATGVHLLAQLHSPRLSRQASRRMGVLRFVAIGVASVFYVELMWLVPILWILLTTNVLAMSLRTFIASILGVALPYWF